MALLLFTLSGGLPGRSQVPVDKVPEEEVEPVQQWHLAAGDGEVHLGGEHVEEGAERGLGVKGLVAPGDAGSQGAAVQQGLLRHSQTL